MIIVLAKGQQQKQKRTKIDYSKITLEKGVPIPKPKGRGRSSKQVISGPYKYMSVGDCFFVPANTGAKPNSILKYGYLVAKKLGIKITARVSKEGLRIWRVK